MSNQVKENLHYTKEHEWLIVDGDIATVGITDYAQEALGDLVYVELPNIGDTVSTGDMFVVVESPKAASDVYAPIAGEVVEVNSDVADNPEHINNDPYGKGWLVKIRISEAFDANNYLNAEAYSQTTQ